MKPTRIVFWTLVASSSLLNSLALLHDLEVLTTSQQIVHLALAFNLIVMPVALLAAHRGGQISEENYRRSVAQKIAVMSTANGEPRDKRK